MGWGRGARGVVDEAATLTYHIVLAGWGWLGYPIFSWLRCHQILWPTTEFWIEDSTLIQPDTHCPSHCFWNLTDSNHFGASFFYFITLREREGQKINKKIKK